MKNMKINYLKKSLLLAIITFVTVSCTRELADDATLSTNSKTAEIFTDTPIGMGTNFYFPYGGDANNPIGSKFSAWTVDQTESYMGTASMRFDVPNATDLGGNYAGGIFKIDGAGRDLSGYDALTFWAKASQGVTIGEIGFGEDFYPNKYITTMTNVSLGTNWVKYIIPIPDASKLINEKGMLRYAAGTSTTNGYGYTFWIDELKFEKLGTMAHPQPKIMNGQTIVQDAFEGSNFTVTGLTQTFNMASGTNQTVNCASSYFTFTSSNPSIATVNELGVVTVMGTGTAIIKATLGGVQALGALTINSLGVFTPAPTPTKPASNVISIYSNAYPNVPVNYTNGYWAPYQTTTSSNFAVNANNVLNYLNFNFVGIEFSSPTVNATPMTNLHLDVFVPNSISPTSNFKVKIVDFGADGTFGGTGTNADLTSSIVSFPGSSFVAGTWKSIDISLTSFTGLPNKAHLAQLILDSTVANVSSISNVYVDNIYFYN